MNNQTVIVENYFTMFRKPDKTSSYKLPYERDRSLEPIVDKISKLYFICNTLGIFILIDLIITKGSLMLFTVILGVCVYMNYKIIRREI